FCRASSTPPIGPNRYLRIAQISTRNAKTWRTTACQDISRMFTGFLLGEGVRCSVLGVRCSVLGTPLPTRTPNTEHLIRLAAAGDLLHHDVAMREAEAEQDGERDEQGVDDE